MKKLVSLACALLVLFSLSACFTDTIGNIQLDDYAFYRNGQKVDVDRDTSQTTLQDVSMADLISLDDTDAHYTTKRNVGIGDSVEDILEAYNDCGEVYIRDTYNIEIAEKEGFEHKSLKKYLSKHSAPLDGQIGYRRYRFQDEWIAKGAVDAYATKGTVYIYALFFKIERGRVLDIYITIVNRNKFNENEK